MRRTGATSRLTLRAVWSNLAAALYELFGVGALEREDRLLLVAHHEQRPWPFGGALAVEEFCDERPDDLPLLRVGVLPLVDQDMADAAVELVTHPGAARFVAEQRAQFLDQIVEVEQRAGALLVLVGRRNGADDLQHGLAALDQLGPIQLALEALEPRRLVVEPLRHVGNQRRRMLLDQGLPRRAGLRQIGVEQQVHLRMLRVDACQPVDEIVAVRFGRDQLEQRTVVHGRRDISFGDLGDHRLAQLPRTDADRLAQIAVGAPGIA